MLLPHFWLIFSIRVPLLHTHSHSAVNAGATGIVTLLLSSQAPSFPLDINKLDEATQTTPLIHAIKAGNIAMVQTLLSHHQAAAVVPEEALRLIDTMHREPHFAAFKTRYSIRRLLMVGG